ATNFSKKELEDLYQPILRLFKRKLEIARTAPNSLLIHGGTFNCKTLAGAFFAKQVTNLFKRLNSVGLVEELTELSIRNSSMYAGLTRDIRVTDPLDNHDKVWRKNLACNIIEKVHLPLFKHKKDKYNKDWIISWMLGRIEKKKERKLLVEHWIKRKVNNGEYFAVRCKHCALNQKGKKNNCITEIKVDSVKGCICNMTKNKENWTLPCALDLLLRRKCVESPLEHKLIDSIKIAEMEIELINGLNLEKETKDLLS
ncbi:36796_t:CDS:2, partial [Gigaspora margarita]